MKKQYLIFSILLMALVLNINAGTTTLQPGAWSGPIKSTAGDLQVTFNIDSPDGKNYSATLDVPAQGAFGIPADEVKIKGNKVTIEIKSVLGKYEGKLQDNGKTLAGKWHQSGLELDCELKHGPKPSGPKRPQNPTEPYPYDATDVTIDSTDPGVKLAGTLTMPKGDGPFPGIVLIHGSGPNDRDETVFGHKPFLVLADHLTRKGIAVLRYDKRGIAGSTGNHITATTTDFTTDATSALNWLRTQPKIDTQKTGLLGHSEGGLIVPRIAVDNPENVAFIVMLAGPGVSGKELLPVQLEAVLKLSAVDDETLSRAKDQQRAMFEIVLNEPDADKATELLNKEMEKRHAELTASERQLPGMDLESMKASAQAVNNPWFREFLTFDPKPVLEKVPVPVLAVFGEKDCQVLPDQSAPIVEAALKTAGNANTVVKVFPGLNHLFQACTTGAPGEYAMIEETINPVFMEFLSNWLLNLK